MQVGVSHLNEVVCFINEILKRRKTVLHFNVDESVKLAYAICFYELQGEHIISLVNMGSLPLPELLFLLLEHKATLERLLLNYISNIPER